MNTTLNELMDGLVETAITFEDTTMQNLINQVAKKTQEVSTQSYLNEYLMDGLIETAIPVSASTLAALLNEN